MYKVQNKHVVSNNVQKHKIFDKDRMNTLQTHKCAKFKKKRLQHLTKAFGADKLVQYQKSGNFFSSQSENLNMPRAQISANHDLKPSLM